VTRDVEMFRPPSGGNIKEAGEAVGVGGRELKFLSQFL
jgi:hypothetical protein